MHYSIKVRTKRVSETTAAGRALGKFLSAGDIVCLTGELGAGKTCFVKGVAAGLGIEGKSVTSPTFIMIREHKGRTPLYHIDLYRTGVIDDMRDLGMEDILYGKGVTVIEWAERIHDRPRDERIDVLIEWVDDKTRDIELKAYGPHHTEVLKNASERLRVVKGKP